MNTAPIPENPVGPQMIPPSLPTRKFPWVTILLIFFFALLSAFSTYWIVKGYPIPFIMSVQKTPASRPTAKPIASETAVDTSAWKTYTNTQAGFSLKYPSTVLFEEEKPESTSSSLSVVVEKMTDIPMELPSFMGRSDAIKLRESLSSGGGNAVKIGSLYGAKGFISSRFEVCSVMFERSLTFFPGDYRVIIYLFGNHEAMFESMPEFFTVDKTNCGERTMWNRGKTPSFREVLSQKQGKGAAQEWYDTFDAIVNTVVLTEQSAANVPAQTAPSPTPVVPANSPTSSCDVADNAFCNIISDLKTALSSQMYAGFLSYQTLQSATCDPDGMFVAVCEGAPKGAVRQGYEIGYNQSEGTMVTRDGYVSSISAYIGQNGPFIYKGSLVSGDTAIAVFLNGKKDKILVFPMKRSGPTWRMAYTLLGGDFNGEFASLSPSILSILQ